MVLFALSLTNLLFALFGATALFVFLKSSAYLKLGLFSLRSFALMMRLVYV